MNRIVNFLCLIIIDAVFLQVTYAHDVIGYENHPIFARMSDFIIADYQETELDSHEFYGNDGQKYAVEGHKVVIAYRLKDDAEPQGASIIKQYYINEVKDHGGEVLDESLSCFKVVTGDTEIWAALQVEDDEGTNYGLIIVEKAAARSEMLTRPEALAREIETKGCVAVYDIFFDEGQAAIQPESESTLVAIATLLEEHPKMRLYVVGHTCSKGPMTANMILSQKRAEAVVNVLTDRFKVEINRLFAAGVGPLCPVASNETEEGRAINCRIELVVQ